MTYSFRAIKLFHLIQNHAPYNSFFIDMAKSSELHSTNPVHNNISQIMTSTITLKPWIKRLGFRYAYQEIWEQSFRRDQPKSASLSPSRGGAAINKS